MAPTMEVARNNHRTPALALAPVMIVMIVMTDGILAIQGPRTSRHAPLYPKDAADPHHHPSALTLLAALEEGSSTMDRPIPGAVVASLYSYTFRYNHSVLCDYLYLRLTGSTWFPTSMQSYTYKLTLTNPLR